MLTAVLSLGATACRNDGGNGDSAGDTETDSAGTESTTGMSAGTDSGTDSMGTGTDSGEPMVDLDPAPGGMRKMMAREYIKSIEVMFGYDAAAAAVPPDDVPQDGFDAVGGWLLSLPSEAIENYERSSTAVADAVVADPSTLAQTVPCITGGQNDACYTTVAETIGRWAFRRSLNQDEVDRIVAIALEGRSWGDGAFMSGLKYELMAILQSPSFLYIVEVGDSDPATGYRRLRPEELATRLAFFLTGRNPDLSLLDIADAGMLDSASQIRAQAQEMIQAPEARLATAAFFDEALRLRNVPTAAKNAELFPTFTPELGEFMRQETLLLVHDIVWEKDGDIRELLNARHTFVNDPLAELYGITPPGEGNLFVEVDWPAGQKRAGYLSQGSFLTWQSGPRRNSPSKRGKFVQELLLCVDIPPPDPNANLNLPEPVPGQTLKELLEQHMENEGCRGCHAQFDPIGFALESFNAIGQFRTEDNGSPVETDGMVATIGEWQDATDLADLLANDPRVPRCLVENLIRGQLGHTPEDGEDLAIDDINDRVADNGYSFQTLMVEFASSPLFRIVNEPK
jgi:hypothetical protein